MSGPKVHPPNIDTSPLWDAAVAYLTARNRQCMAACAGIAEPEKAIPALVNAVNFLLGYIEGTVQTAYPEKVTAVARAALALVQPALAVQTVRERELHRAAQAEAAMANDPDLEGHTEKEGE